MYVYCIITRSYISPFGNTDLTFFLDGERISNFTLPANGNGTYLYNQLVFMQDGLDGDAEHTIRLENGHAQNRSVVLLDRIVYT